MSVKKPSRSRRLRSCCLAWLFTAIPVSMPVHSVTAEEDWPTPPQQYRTDTKSSTSVDSTYYKDRAFDLPFHGYFFQYRSDLEIYYQCLARQKSATCNSVYFRDLITLGRVKLFQKGTRLTPLEDIHENSGRARHDVLGSGYIHFGPEI